MGRKASTATVAIAPPFVSFIRASPLHMVACGVAYIPVVVAADWLLAFSRMRCEMFMAFVALTTIFQFTSGRAEICEDGLRTTWLGLVRSFVPWHDVDDVALNAFAPGARFRLKGKGRQAGKEWTIAVPSYYWTPSARARESAHVFVDHVAQALAAHRSALAADAVVALPIDVSDDVASAQWIEHVRKLSGSDDHYRSAAIDRDALRDLVTRSTRRASARAAAAYVLMCSKEKSNEDVACVERALASTGNDRLRVALNALVQNRVEAADEALSELHDRDQRASRSGAV